MILWHDGRPVIVAVVGQERKVAFALRDLSGRRLFADEILQRREAEPAGCVGGSRKNRQAIFPEYVDRDARQRLATADRLHEDIATGVGGVLHHQSQIGQQHEARIGNSVLCFGQFATIHWRVRIHRQVLNTISEPLEG